MLFQGFLFLNWNLSFFSMNVTLSPSLSVFNFEPISYFLFLSLRFVDPIRSSVNNDTWSEVTFFCGGEMFEDYSFSFKSFEIKGFQVTGGTKNVWIQKNRHIWCLQTFINFQSPKNCCRLFGGEGNCNLIIFFDAGLHPFILFW